MKSILSWFQIDMKAPELIMVFTCEYGFIDKTSLRLSDLQKNWGNPEKAHRDLWLARGH